MNQVRSLFDSTMDILRLLFKKHFGLQINELTFNKYSSAVHHIALMSENAGIEPKRIKIHRA
jgi:hypothetical protein